MATVYVETYGCQMNVLDSTLIQDQLAALGYSFGSSISQADVVLINTCSVRELSEQRVWSLLGRLGVDRRRGRDMVIGVVGCMAEREGEGFFKRAPQVDLVCGPSELDRLPAMIANALAQKNGEAQQVVGHQTALSGHNSRRSQTLEAAQDRLETLDLSRAFSPSTGGRQAYVRITRGCNKFCAFCVVPYTRGAEVHRAPDGIVGEVQRLADSGVQEVTLIGQTVNHYAFSDGGKTTSFADLLVQVHDAVPSLPRLRFVTSYPRDFGDDALDAMAACPRICRYLHIPAQSGSNKMLRAMNRGYTVEAYESLLERARARMPDICLAGDMIVGFPGELEEDHQASIELLKRARYKSCFVFKYSPRPNTVAERRLEDSIPQEVKKARNNELLAVQQEISLTHHRNQVGKVVQVLIERQGKVYPQNDMVQVAWEKPNSSIVRLLGRTGGDEIVAFDGPSKLVGHQAHVQIDSATPLTMLGHMHRQQAAAQSPQKAPQTLRPTL